MGNVSSPILTVTKAWIEYCLMQFPNGTIIGKRYTSSGKKGVTVNYTDYDEMLAKTKGTHSEEGFVVTVFLDGEEIQP